MAGPTGTGGRDMSRWLGDGGMPLLAEVGLSFDGFGVDADGCGYSTARFEPRPLACNPFGVVQAGVHAVVLDAAMNFAVNAGLSGPDRAKATIELKTETMRPAGGGEAYRLRGVVVRETRQIAFAEGRLENEAGELVSRATGTFLIRRG